MKHNQSAKTLNDLIIHSTSVDNARLEAALAARFPFSRIAAGLRICIQFAPCSKAVNAIGVHGLYHLIFWVLCVCVFLSFFRILMFTLAYAQKAWLLFRESVSGNCVRRHVCRQTVRVQCPENQQEVSSRSCPGCNYKKVTSTGISTSAIYSQPHLLQNQ